MALSLHITRFTAPQLRSMLLCLLIAATAAAGSAAGVTVVHVDCAAAVGTVDSRFLSVAIDASGALATPSTALYSNLFTPKFLTLSSFDRHLR